MNIRVKWFDWSVICTSIMVLIFIVHQIAWSGDDLQIIGGFVRTEQVSFTNIWITMTTQWLHINVIHLLINILALLYLNNELRKYNTLGKNFLIYVTGMIVVGIALIMFSKEGTLYIGSSGAIAALLGAYVINLLCHGVKREKVVALETTLLFILLTFIIPGISVLMHLVGFLVSIIFELLYFYFLSQRSD